MVTRRVSEGEAATESALAYASGYHLRSPRHLPAGRRHGKRQRLKMSASVGANGDVAERDFNNGTGSHHKSDFLTFPRQSAWSWSLDQESSR